MMFFVKISQVLLLCLLIICCCGEHNEYSSRYAYNLSSLMFNGLSEKCNRTLENMSADTRLRYLDSWGKPGAGILSGNVKWFGAFDQCIAISGGKYCLVTMLGNITNKTIPIWYGICLPNVCVNADSSIVVQNFLNNIGSQFFPTVKVIDLNCYKEPKYTWSVILTIILCGIILSCCLIGTCIDVYKETIQTNCVEYMYLGKEYSVIKPQEIHFPAETTPLVSKKNGMTGYRNGGLDYHNAFKESFKLETSEKQSEIPKNKSSNDKNDFIVDIFLCFSLLRNSRNIMKTDAAADNLLSLNGIRVITILWIILDHTYGVARYPQGILENLLDFYDETRKFTEMIIVNSFVTVDTFFFLSGFLVMYKVMKILEQNNGVFQWSMLYVHRFFRLTPAMMFVILFNLKLKPFVSKGPLWEQHLKEDEGCRKYWWTNLLYLNNFYPSDITRACNGVLWYLAVDMQFFIIAPFIICFFYRYGYRAVVATSLVLGGGSIVYIAVMTEHYNLHPLTLVLRHVTLKKFIEYFNYLYVKPYARFPPCLVGLVFGYLWRKGALRKNQLNWTKASLLWFLSTAVALSLIYGPYTAIKKDPRPWTMFEKIFYASTYHLVWAFVLSWVVYACEFGYGGYVKDFLSASFWIPLGRLTYSTYLVHRLVLKVMMYGSRTGLVFTTQWWAYIYCGTVLLSHALAFLLAITIEYPVFNLEKLVFGGRRGKAT
ncbi:nose resistant to fluoxetine protein 6-like isoform X2 [Xenia sp. Carnegie-2017]|uniref:nose resistant to fluoxetine protein 6-like isoform X2 n=2 Tax=Xenia sp. Carnegie-2017 TaxID=2897299 RepID=UPI001F044010|nr:nose resistant to fluoxetine protein 6-like isoform X2 [Xenia sp. Carnegie-2017]